MARYPRYFILKDKCYFHITWQCHNKDWLLKEDWAKKHYYNLLLKHHRDYAVQIHSFCFMDSHPHLTGYCNNAKMLSDMMRRINTSMAKAINKYYQRRGQAIMDRFKSPIIETDQDLLSIMAYIDLNPVRARMVPHPTKYRWSSYAYYAYGKKNPLITPAPSYLGLAETHTGRQNIYRKMVLAIMLKGNKKKNYSYTYFIGNPLWVKKKSETLKNELLKKLKNKKQLTET